MASRTPFIVVALLVTWLVWGSSFVAISWALESIPPLLLMATRFVVAGSLATGAGLLLARRSGAAMPCRRAWRDSSLVGLGFITVGMGATGWAATRLPTGVASLLVASAPLWIALLQAIRPSGVARSRVALGGLLVGLVGVCILVAPGGSSGGIDVTAALVLVAANAIWAAASLFAPRAMKPEGLVLGVGMQMLTGGLVLLAVALASGEGARFSLATVTPRAAGGWAYLVVVAAIGGFLAYNFLLANVSAGTASTHAFINPLVAVALGAMVLGEQVGTRMLVAGGAVVLAVVLLLVGEARTARASRPYAAVVSDSHPAAASGRIARPRSTRRSGGVGWSPAPTPAFAAARRAARPLHVTDGMDALEIDAALDGFG
jgi:drug/metabolite transporter (DMT)-like permease